jgi:hypothetical protein
MASSHRQTEIQPSSRKPRASLVVNTTLANNVDDEEKQQVSFLSFCFDVGWVIKR